MNKCECYLTTLKFLRRDDWWDNNKMRAKTNVAEVEDIRYLRPLFRIKTNVNSTCDVTNLDQIGLTNVQDV